jgi:uncharacterized membrane protein
MEGNQTPNENVTNQTTPGTVTPVVAPAAANTNAEPASNVEFNETTIMAALSYFGPLVIIPYLTKKENPFVIFHIKQGLVLLVPYLVLWVIGNYMYMMLGPLSSILGLLNLAIVVLSIIGIVNAVQKKEKPLPLVGQYSSYFKI